MKLLRLYEFYTDFAEKTVFILHSELDTFRYGGYTYLGGGKLC